MSVPWPPGFERIPDEAWTQQPVEELALDYDTVEHHGWYANLDPTVREAAELLGDGDVLLDYSGGTGILLEHLLEITDEAVGLLDVDSSRKFLRLAIDKLGDEEQVAFRRIRYLDERERLQFVDEILDPALLEPGIDVITSTNAIHLYYNLPETLASWRRVVDDDGHVLVQSGNIDRTERPEDRWIIDATVRAVDEAARRIVREDEAYARHRSILEDEERMARYEALRDRFFLPARGVDHYVCQLTDAGFTVERVVRRPVEVDAEEWSEFLQVYDEGVLGWVGGSERIEDDPPTEEDLAERAELIDRALERVLEGAESFEAEWTYLTCRPA